jgi:hypothetical protein
MHAGYDRLRQPGQRQHQPTALVEQPARPGLVAGVGAHFLEIVAGAETSPLGGQYDRANIRIDRNRRQLGEERGDHLRRERVEALGAVERQSEHVIVFLRQHEWLVAVILLFRPRSPDPIGRRLGIIRATFRQ